MLVCVRRGVQGDRELSGDVGAVEVGGEQPEHVQLALAQGLDQALAEQGAVSRAWVPPACSSRRT